MQAAGPSRGKHPGVPGYFTAPPPPALPSLHSQASRLTEETLLLGAHRHSHAPARCEGHSRGAEAGGQAAQYASQRGAAPTASSYHLRTALPPGKHWQVRATSTHACRAVIAQCAGWERAPAALLNGAAPASPTTHLRAERRGLDWLGRSPAPRMWVELASCCIPGGCYVCAGLARGGCRGSMAGPQAALPPTALGDELFRPNAGLCSLPRARWRSCFARSHPSRSAQASRAQHVTNSLS